MKVLRLALAAVLLSAACDAPDPVTPLPTPGREVEPRHSVPPCDSTCQAERNPAMGGSSG